MAGWEKMRRETRAKEMGYGSKKGKVDCSTSGKETSRERNLEEGPCKGVAEIKERMESYALGWAKARGPSWEYGGAIRCRMVYGDEGQHGYPVHEAGGGDMPSLVMAQVAMVPPEW